MSFWLAEAKLTAKEGLPSTLTIVMTKLRAKVTCFSKRPNKIRYLREMSNSPATANKKTTKQRTNVKNKQELPKLRTGKFSYNNPKQTLYN